MGYKTFVYDFHIFMMWRPVLSNTLYFQHLSLKYSVLEYHSLFLIVLRLL